MRMSPCRQHGPTLVLLALSVLPWGMAATADAQPADPLRVNAPPVVVTALKEPADVQAVPASVTAVPADALDAWSITTLGEAVPFAPNTFFSEFQARKLSFPRFRGISSGPGNPAITTYVDGVPMIHTNASSVELLDVEQVEFVRGGQSALFGRNALGGVVNVSSTRPSLQKWTGQVTAPVGNFGSWGVRGSVSGPLSARTAVSLAAGRSERDGFTTNVSTGQDIDRRGSTFAKAQFLWIPSPSWETRVIVSGERARDGDYALADLGSLRAAPFRASRDFIGHLDRDILSAAFVARHVGRKLSVTTTTGVVDWRTKDETDLDYTPLPLFTRGNEEQATQVTQEVRLASTPAGALSLGGATLKWQAGGFLFSQQYDQNAVNRYSPFVLSSLLPFPVQETSPAAALDDVGLGLYGQGTLTFGRADLAIGARLDHEQKDADIQSFFTPTIAPPNRVQADRSFTNVSPQASLSIRVQPDKMVYASVSSGYKSGGFNAASPVGAEAFAEEHTVQVEGGVKTILAGGRLLANAAVFYIDWNDLQLNLPNPQVPAQFYIANVGGARSAGVEAELTAKASEKLDVFGLLGYTHARFGDGSRSSGLDVSGNTLPSTPDITGTIGAQFHHPLTAQMQLHVRGEVAFVGSYLYDDANTASQDAYALATFRGGVRRGPLSVEAWIRNAFDARYIPVAFAYPGLAPSGFVGEMGHPRTFGISLGARF